jgi:hypothetical protein
MTASTSTDVTAEVFAAARDFADDSGAFTVADLVTLTGRGETSIRKAINQGVIDGTIGKADGRGQFMFLPADAFEADLPQLENPPENLPETPADYPAHDDSDHEPEDENGIPIDTMLTSVMYTPVELIETTNALIDAIADREQTDGVEDYLGDIAQTEFESHNYQTWIEAHPEAEVELVDEDGNLVTESDDDDDDDDTEDEDNTVHIHEVMDQAAEIYNAEAAEAVDLNSYRVEAFGPKGQPVVMRRRRSWVLIGEDELEAFKAATKLQVAGYSPSNGKRKAILELRALDANGAVVVTMYPQKLKAARGR